MYVFILYRTVRFHFSYSRFFFKLQILFYFLFCKFADFAPVFVRNLVIYNQSITIFDFDNFDNFLPDHMT